MTALPLGRRFLNALILYRSPSIIVNAVADLSLLLLVAGRQLHFLSLPSAREPSIVILLSLVPFPLRLFFQITLYP